MNINNIKLTEVSKNIDNLKKISDNNDFHSKLNLINRFNTNNKNLMIKIKQYEQQILTNKDIIKNNLKQIKMIINNSIINLDKNEKQKIINYINLCCSKNKNGGKKTYKKLKKYKKSKKNKRTKIKNRK